MAFEGWLLKCGGTEIPMRYIKYQTYSVTPNQRLDLTAERDMTGVLHRDTVAHMPVKIEFTTPYLYNTDVEALNGIIRGAYTERRGRTIPVQYYDPEDGSYKSAVCYMPDTQYKIYNVNVDKKIILYEPLRYAFIEY